MGWDAYAEPFNGLKKVDGRIPDFPPGDPEFSSAVDKVLSKSSSVDCMLRHGGLDCSACARMLERATRRSVYGEPWTALEVRAIAKTAVWDFPIEPGEMWAFWSARAFLDKCAELGRGIRFSW